MSVANDAHSAPEPGNARLEAFSDGVFAIAITLYCGSFTVTAVFYFLLWRHASRGRRLIAPHVSDETVAAVTRAYRPGSVLYLLATLFAFVNVAVSLAIVTGLAILYLLPRRGAHAADAGSGGRTAIPGS